MASPLVFVVDDEKLIAKTLALILNQTGFSAQPFFDALEAIQAADTAAPDILITDVVMPGMNGIELAINFRRAHPECRVILFSGISATAELLDEAMREGHHFEVIAKPVNPKDLIDRLRKLKPAEK